MGGSAAKRDRRPAAGTARSGGASGLRTSRRRTQVNPWRGIRTGCPWPMCGIVGYIGTRDAGPILMDCLKRLEYRGYDSAGVGVIQEDRLELRRSAGKIAELERVLGQRPVHGRAGIAHTRWATHGRPSAANAHPHSDCASSVAVVHNGIIENHRPLRRALESQGHRFGSQTDTEVIPHLIESRQGEIETATQEAVRELEGDYALGIISRRDPGKLVAVRSGGPPLIVGFAPDGLFLTSDASAILPYTREVLSLEEGEMAVLSGEGVRLATFDGRTVDRSSRRGRSASPISVSRPAPWPASGGSCSSPAGPPGTPPWWASTCWSRSAGSRWRSTSRRS